MASGAMDAPDWEPPLIQSVTEAQTAALTAHLASLQRATSGSCSPCPKSHLQANRKALLNASPIAFLQGPPGHLDWKPGFGLGTRQALGN